MKFNLTTLAFSDNDDWISDLFLKPIKNDIMQDNPNSLKWEHIDIAGIALSFICGIHCVILPLALVMLPSVGWSIHSNHSFETIMVILIIALGATVLVKGYLNHGRWQVILFLAFGSVIFLFVRPALGNSMHAYTSVIGGISFIIGHLYNWNWCRTCPVCRASNAVCEVSLDKSLGK